MAAGEKKKAIWDTPCVKDGEGCWGWKTTEHEWRFSARGMGQCQVRLLGDERWQDVAFFRTLDTAVMFSLGYDYGRISALGARK